MEASSAMTLRHTGGFRVCIANVVVGQENVGESSAAGELDEDEHAHCRVKCFLYGCGQLTIHAVPLSAILDDLSRLISKLFMPCYDPIPFHSQDAAALLCPTVWTDLHAWFQLETMQSPMTTSSTACSTDDESNDDVESSMEGSPKPGSFVELFLQTNIDTTSYSRRCMAPNCTRASQHSRFCLAHGGGKCCKVADCANAAQSMGFCKAHGGGARCKFEGCHKSSQGGGLCRAHGGGKRCTEKGCDKGVQRGNKCTKHGGCWTCTIAGCKRTDRGGGLCIIHRREKTCKVDGCNRLSVSMGLCKPHIRSLLDDHP
ncbi:hypothetical protein AC1031_003491 [Aphanomyces cochlioides]|nr:hypothetical protein AC1031_003491 [Aphanomyces cochlioides]